MNRKKKNRKVYPVVYLDKSLDKYGDEPLFKEKWEKANETINRVGLPKDINKQ